MNSVNLTSAAAINTPAAGAERDDPERVRDAASQFEALLIGQLLHSARSNGGGWLGAPEDSSSDSATDYAEQQFAATMAQAGGLGLASMIERGLKAPSSPPADSRRVPGSAHSDKAGDSTSPVPKSPGR